MNIKPVFKYFVADSKRALLIYYAIIYLILFLTVILLKSMNIEGEISSIDVATMIFLLVIGMNLFKAPFRLFLQNGVSRKTMFVSFLCFSGCICAFMAILDQINYRIFSCFSTYAQMFSWLYAGRYETMFGVQQTLEGIVWSLFGYLLFTVLGFFITVLYYRCNKWQKFAISIGVPGVLFIILPLLDGNFFQGQIILNIVKFFRIALGLEYGVNPLIGTLSFAIGAAILGGITFLLMRKAPVKE